MSGNREQGSNWIRRAKRLRIYERDGWRCVWCGCRVYAGHKGADGAAKHPAARGLATLDHFLPRSAGGGNEHTNLLTACIDCNHLRDAASALDWAARLESVGAAGFEALDRAIEALARPLPGDGTTAARARTRARTRRAA